MPRWSRAGAALTIEQRPAGGGRVRVVRPERCRRRTILEARILMSGPETGGYGLSGCSVLFVVGDRLGRPFSVRAVEAARRVAVARGDAPGVQLGADPAYRHMSERGKRPGGAHRTLRVWGRRTVRCRRRGVAEDP